MTDDTQVIPETITAPWVKRFFKKHLGLVVKVNNAAGPGWVTIRVVLAEQRINPELGQRCMSIVYNDSEKLSAQSYGGNINGDSISLFFGEFKLLLQSLLDNPINSTPNRVTGS